MLLNVFEQEKNICSIGNFGKKSMKKVLLITLG